MTQVWKHQKNCLAVVVVVVVVVAAVAVAVAVVVAVVVIVVGGVVVVAVIIATKRVSVRGTRTTGPGTWREVWGLRCQVRALHLELGKIKDSSSRKALGFKDGGLVLPV